MPIERGDLKATESLNSLGTEHVYILNDKKEVVKPVDYTEFTIWMANAREGDGVGKRVAWDDINGVFVSTIFLGHDHRFLNRGNEPPIVFETMIFGSPGMKLDQTLQEYQERYCTWEEAEAGHQRAVELVKKILAGEKHEEN